jgi:ABC-type transporter Mla MlaB component
MGLLVITGRITPADVPALCHRVRTMLRAGDQVVVCDVRGLVVADLAAVDALARLQLAAHTLGGRMRLLHASAELQELLALVGLTGALSCGGLGGGPLRQAEQREQAGGVQERVHRDDPPA